jgi:predicted permease
MLGYWLERWIVAGLPDSLPPAFQFGLDGTVLFFSALAAVIAALMFGLVPALRGSRTAVEELRRGGAGRAGVTSGFGSFLIVMQTALAMVLLVGGGMMTRSLLELMKQDMGFEAEGVLTMRFSAPEARYPDDDALHRFWDDAMASLASIPGVESVGAIQSLPLGGDNWGATFWLEGQEDPASDQGRASRLEYISHDYPGAMGLDIIAGRGFETADNGSSPGVALVTESFARAHFAGTDVLGTRLLSSGLRVPVTIVGVVEDHLSRGIDRAAEPALLLSLEQRPLRSRAVAVRTRGDAADLADVVRATIRTIDAEVPVYDVRTMRERVTSSVGSFALLAELMGGFALTSLLLGAIGIYGVTAYAVARRSAEIGIRMALGATASSVTWLVIGQGARRIAFGLVLGTVLALLLARSMRAILFNVSPTDPVTLTSVGLVLAALGLLGSWLPARKASRLDPASTLSSRSG